VVAIVAILLLAGLIPGVHLGSSSGGSGPTLTSSGQASPLASAMATRISAGSLYGVFGISPTIGFSGTLESFFGCDLSAPTTGNVSIAGNTGTYYTGTAVGWLFIYYSAGNTTVSIIGVLGTQAELIAKYTGAGCAAIFGNLAPLPTTYSNSTVATTIADTLGLGISAFLIAHPQASAEYALMASNSTHAPAVWRIFYSTCAIGPMSGSGTGDNATTYLNAGDAGAYPLTANVTNGGTCNGGGNPVPGLGGLEFVGWTYSMSGVDSGGYYDAFNVTGSAGLTTAGFGLLVIDSTFGTANIGPVPSTCIAGAVASTACPEPSGAHEWYAVLTSYSTGKVLATYGGSNWVWTYGVGVSSLPIVSGDQIVVVSNDLLRSSGDYVTPFGTTAGSGTVLVVGANAL
jgi:hypothetical protein